MPLDITDIPAALTTLDNRVTALEKAETTTASADPRTDDIITVLERFFGKELSDAKIARTTTPAVPTPAAPVAASPGVNVTPGPVAAPAPATAPAASVAPPKA